MHFINNRLESIQGLGQEFLICATAGNLMVCVTSFIAAPSAIEFSKLHMDVRKPVIVALILVLVVTMGAFIMLLSYFSQRHGKHLKIKTSRSI